MCSIYTNKMLILWDKYNLNIAILKASDAAHGIITERHSIYSDIFIKCGSGPYKYEISGFTRQSVE